MAKKKYRMSSWYWGNYVTRRKTNYYIDDRGRRLQLNDSDMEDYDEEKHGWHNSEEFKKGRKKPYRDTEN